MTARNPNVPGINLVIGGIESMAKGTTHPDDVALTALSLAHGDFEFARAIMHEALRRWAAVQQLDVSSLDVANPPCNTDPKENEHASAT